MARRQTVGPVFSSRVKATTTLYQRLGDDYFDVRIPGFENDQAADGQTVSVDEFRTP